jgi:uncharacterized protein YegP (UPF0339 family)
VLQIEKGKPTSRVDVLVRVLEALGLTLEVRAAPRSLTRAVSEPLSYIEIDRSGEGAYRWWLKATNGQILAASPGEYASREAASSAVRQIVSIGSAAGSKGRGPEVFRDAEGSYRWRLKAANGQLIATGYDSYRSQQAARRAAHHALLTASAAEVR